MAVEKLSGWFSTETPSLEVEARRSSAFCLGLEPGAETGALLAGRDYQTGSLARLLQILLKARSADGSSHAQSIKSQRVVQPRVPESGASPNGRTERAVSCAVADSALGWTGKNPRARGTRDSRISRVDRVARPEEAHLESHVPGSLGPSSERTRIHPGVCRQAARRRRPPTWSLPAPARRNRNARYTTQKYQRFSIHILYCRLGMQVFQYALALEPNHRGDREIKQREVYLV
ncbi:unnamed protein product [Diplocarpon coronariae]